MSGWFGFWIFMAVFVSCDTYLYDKGHDTYLWKHRTPVELQLQQQQIEKPKGCE